MAQRTFNTETIKVTATVSFEIEGLTEDLGAELVKALSTAITG